MACKFQDSNVVVEEGRGEGVRGMGGRKKTHGKK